jgi:hypothetical protein
MVALNAKAMDDSAAPATMDTKKKEAADRLEAEAEAVKAAKEATAKKEEAAKKETAAKETAAKETADKTKSKKP